MPLRTPSPAARRDRDWLPCQRRFIKDGAGREDDAIGGNDFSCPHKKRISCPHRFGRNIGNAISIPAVGNARRFSDERFQVPLGAGDREIFEDIAAGIHHSNNDCGKRRAQGQGGDH